MITAVYIMYMHNYMLIHLKVYMVESSAIIDSASEFRVQSRIHGTEYISVSVML